MAEADPRVLAERSEGLLTLTLSAPGRGNSVDAAMLTQLEEHLLPLARGAAADPSLRLVVLRGAGKSFSTGYHVPSLLDELDEGRSVSDFESHPLERALQALVNVAVPTLALVHGNAYGAGCELSLACDLRLASEAARFCMPPAKLGVLYSATGMRRLLELVGPGRTKDLLFSARVVDGRGAYELGLVERVVAAEAFDEAAAKLIASIAGNAPLSIRHTKTVLHDVLAAAPLSAQTLAEVAELRDACFQSADFAERSAALGRRARGARPPSTPTDGEG